MRNRRMDRLEEAFAPDDPPMTFRLCTAPQGLSSEAHALWHKDRGEEIGLEFTINLGDCDIREGE
jgi:hypothetical protein